MKDNASSAYHRSKVTVSMVIILMGDRLYKHHMLAITKTATQYSLISSTWDSISDTWWLLNA
jgi:hypothetical protein